MVKYLGSKRGLVPLIGELARRIPARTACDLFAGTTRVGQELRRAGLVVHSNDLATYSEAFGQAYIAADESTLDRDRLRGLLAELAALPGRDGYVTRTFCEEARFFQPHNGRRIDAIRDAIDELDRHAGRARRAAHVACSRRPTASTPPAACRWPTSSGGRRARTATSSCASPRRSPGPAGTVSRLDALDLAPALTGTDLVYLDPPYNQHSYYSNYHVWETLMRWDAPEAYGVARKRVDCRTTKSPFNRTREAWGALERLVTSITAPWIVLSFSDEGFHDAGDLAGLLAERGHVRAVTVERPRYVGARIGIHDPSGARVGTVSHVRNRETLWVTGPSAAAVDRVTAGLTGASAPGAAARAA